jgi:hypothetical protein
MSYSNPAEAGKSNISLFTITSNYGPTNDVSNGVLELKYYESILDTTVRAIATIIDTGYRGESGGESMVEKSDGNLTVGEKVEIVMVDGNKKKISLTGKNHLRIKNHSYIESNKTLSFTVDLYSKEEIDNELVDNRVTQHYEGKVTDSVQEILTKCLKTKKSIDIDPCLNKLVFNGHTEKPLFKCTSLATKCVPTVSGSKGILAGYLFYQTADGFKFKSIDKLFEQAAKKKLIYNELVTEDGPPPGYHGKIRDYSFDSSFDLDNILATGSYLKSVKKGFNLYNHSYRENDFDSSSQFKGKNNGGKEKPKVAADLGLESKSTKIFSSWDDTGTAMPGDTMKKQLQKTKKGTEINFDKDEIARQSSFRYNQLFSIKLSVTIDGDLSLRAGDLIHCDFPEVSGNKNTKVSQKKSGLYMIANVCHRITKNSCYTRLDLIRDSIGRKSF